MASARTCPGLRQACPDLPRLRYPGSGCAGSWVPGQARPRWFGGGGIAAESLQTPPAHAASPPVCSTETPVSLSPGCSLTLTTESSSASDSRSGPPPQARSVCWLAHGAVHLHSRHAGPWAVSLGASQSMLLWNTIAREHRFPPFPRRPIKRSWAAGSCAGA